MEINTETFDKGFALKVLESNKVEAKLFMGDVAVKYKDEYLKLLDIKHSARRREYVIKLSNGNSYTLGELTFVNFIHTQQSVTKSNAKLGVSNLS